MNHKQAATLLVMVFITLLGMAGLYLLLWTAWQKYQAANAQIQSGPLGGLISFGSSSASSGAAK